MTGSVKLKVQPVAHKAAVASPSKTGAAAAAKAVNGAVLDAASAGGRKKAGTASGADAATVAAATKKPAAGTGRKTAALAVTKTAPVVSAPRKAESAKPVKPRKAESTSPLKPGKAEAPEPAITEAAAAPAKKPATNRAGATKVKLNKRSTDTIARILETTGEIILQSGADRISILDVCEQAGISRGTFYRYFASQDELLDAFSRHMRDQFHAKLLQATAGTDDPDERFQAVLGFVDNYLEKSRAGRLLLVAPEYALRWFQRIFNDSVHRFQDILSISFDAWEERRGITLDRELICELMVRFILSEVLVPSGAERRNLMRRIERFVVMLLSGRVARR
jgi:AcrR family transcriptional regulator